MNRHQFFEAFSKLEQQAPRRKEILQRVLRGQTCAEIAQSLGVDEGTVRKQLSNIYKEFGLTGEFPGDRRSRHTDLIDLFKKYKPEFIDENALNQKRKTARIEEGLTLPSITHTECGEEITKSYIDWGEAPDIPVFYGRTEELAKLERWIVSDRCRLVALLGMGGIGKTTLSVKLAEKIQDNFQYLIWRSLREAPPIEKILENLIKVLSNQQETDFSDSLSEKVNRLIKYIRTFRCLIILDNIETILQADDCTGSYLEGYESYEALISRIAEERHISCLILTTREKPRKVAELEGERLTIRSFQLTGLNEAEGQEIFKAKGSFSGTDEEWKKIIKHYAGNPLALKLVAAGIQDVFNSSISKFIKELLNQGRVRFANIQDLLERQFNRLSDLEKEVMYWLAINYEIISLDELREDVVSPELKQGLPDVLTTLRRRSLIETSDSGFTLQNVVMEYMTDLLIEQVSKEIKNERFEIFNNHALIKATAKDYVRDTQSRLILKPVAERLGNSKQQLDTLMQTLRSQPDLSYGYAAGNILNIFCSLNTDLSDYDFSNLEIRQAYLKGCSLSNLNIAYSDLSKSVFTQIFGRVSSVAFSPDGSFLAVSDTNGEIYLCQGTSYQPILICQGHTYWIWAMAFSPDGQILASGSEDGTIKLWDVNTGRCQNTLRSHPGRVWSVAFSPDGQTLASGSDDQTVRIWDVNTGQCQNILQGHDDWIWSVAFSPDGQTLASGSYDQTVRIWDVNTGRCRHTLQRHSDWIWSVAFSSDGQTLASGSYKILRLWNVNAGHCRNALQEHKGWIWSVAFSPDGQTLATGSDDKTIRLWDASTGQCKSTLKGHTDRIRIVAFSPDGQTLATGSDDRTVKLWDISTGQCRTDLEGHTNRVWSVAFSPDGQALASGGDDRTVKLWDISTGQCHITFQEHTSTVRSVAFSPDGQMIVSSSDDKTIKLWHINTGQCQHTLQGHGNWVWSVGFSSNGQILASGSHDQTVRLWDVNSGQCQNVLEGHISRIRSIAFSPDGQTLASGSDDETIRLWELETGRCLNILRAPRPYEGMNITGVTGLTPIQKGILKALGAIDDSG